MKPTLISKPKCPSELGGNEFSEKKVLKLKLIVAYDRNRVMGKGQDLPWRLPADLAHFKRETMGKTVVMGRKTWESIGFPLPKRKNVVLSRTLQQIQEGVDCFNDLESALEALQGEEDVMIIGGATLYSQALEMGVDEIILTKVMADVEGDVIFPEWDESAWKLLGEEFRSADDKNPYDLIFCRYQPR
jgi:dihydrofolate reductase